MDHGDPTADRGEVLFCSDEHVTIRPGDDGPPTVGEHVRIWPAHVDPTIALHDRMHLVDGEDVVDTWAVDLRGWQT
jgi:D-serine deaminase-like pyridoxal phosphate-dependent protein